MSSSQKLSTNIRNFIETKKDILEELTSDFSELYRLDRFNITSIGSAFNIRLSNEDEEILFKKYNLHRDQFNKKVIAFVNTVHHLLVREVEEVSKLLSAEELEKYKERVKIVSKFVDSNPSIKNSYITYNLSKIPFFSDIDWEAELKVFDSSSLLIVEKATAPVGRIKIELGETIENPPKTTAFTFEISSKELDYMIKSLEAMKNALSSLNDTKIVSKKRRINSEKKAQ